MSLCTPAHIRGISTVLSAVCLLFPLVARAFPIMARPQPVIEYFNVALGHYFLAINPAEMAAIEAGSAGPGWARTGFSFDAHPVPVPPGAYCPGDCGTAVSRFYGTPGLGPNSHFYTANAAEAQFLQRAGSGWSLEKLEFSIPLPDAAGQCGPGLVPVYRVYNNRWMYNDSNHRFVADQAQRDRMLARGWVDEGVAFCAYGAREMPIKSFLVAIDLDRKVLPSAECEDERVNLGPCMALNNLPVPRNLMGPYDYMEPPPSGFFERTGVSSLVNYVVNVSPTQAAIENVFVQGGTGSRTSIFGIHVDTRNRGASLLSSVNPLYQLQTTVAPGAFDPRFFPRAPAEDAVQLKVRYVVNIKSLQVRNGQSHAFGHPTLEFMDRRGGRNLYFTALTYGTVDANDLLVVDGSTGKVIVGTTLRATSPYLRNFGLPSLYTAPGFVAPNYWGWGGAFEFRMDRAEFQRVLDAARTLDATLSADPADYLLDNFHFNNEVFGDGEIGLNIADFQVELVRR